MRLFVSYAHVDRPIVEPWIIQNLKAGGHDVWYDDGLVIGQVWQQELAEQIYYCDALIFCMTSESVESTYCRWELDYAARHNKPILPVLLRDIAVLPPEFRQLHYVDFRAGPTGEAVARLMSGLLHFPRPALPLSRDYTQDSTAYFYPVRDEKQRSFRRFGATVFVALLTVVIVAFAALAFLQSTDGNNATSESDIAPPTPVTPVVVALHDLEIRSGPGPAFPRLAVLPLDGMRDILGISADQLWYQVQLFDGSSGWVLSSPNGVRLEGDRDIVRVIVPTPTPTNTPTITPSPTATATSTPTASAAPTVALNCSGIAGQFVMVWGQVQHGLGCPIGGNIIGGKFVEENFEHGVMLWRGEAIDTAQALVAFDDGTWQIFQHPPYNDGDPEFPCADANTPALSPPTPRRGFGTMWCNIPEIRDGLGNAVDAEREFDGYMQQFTGGFMLQNERGTTYIFYNDGTWERR